MDSQSQQNDIDFSSLRQTNKYLDLALQIDTETIFVHKILICEKSGFIAMLLEHEEMIKGSWPPINALNLTLPDNISFKTFEASINYLYGEKMSENSDAINIIISLIYLSVDTVIIMALLKNYIPNHVPLEEQYIKIIVYLLDHYNVKDYKSPFYSLITFYGTDLLGYIDIPEDIHVFGREMPRTWTEQRYRLKASLKSGLPDYIVSTESKWIHLKRLQADKCIPFEAFGIKWYISRYIYSFGYNDNEDLTKIYVSEKFESNESNKLNIRIFFFIYFADRIPHIQISCQDKLNPNEYKLSYMKNNYKSNKLGFNMPIFEEENVRVSILIENLELNIPEDK